MTNTLVIILSETRASEITFDGFKKNVIDELGADLCVCIGVKSDYNYQDPFYKAAKYKFVYDEPTDFTNAFDEASSILSESRPKYERVEGINSIHGKIRVAKESTDTITYYGNTLPNLDEVNDDEIVEHSDSFPDMGWKNEVYGLKKSDGTSVKEEHVATYKKPLNWRVFLEQRRQFMGPLGGHPGSAGILIFFRWFLLKNLIDSNILTMYDNFIITRSDFIYQLPHPPLNLLDMKYIWFPNGEGYGGYTDRHVVLSKENIVKYLDIFNNFVLKSNDYSSKINGSSVLNLEQLIRFNLEENKVGHLVKYFPYVMYSIRNINGPSRWAQGTYYNELGYYIKYDSEYKESSKQKQAYEESGLNISDFYKKAIEESNMNLP
jgi:hypothetical protein